MAQLIQGAQLRLIAHSGHMTTMERPGAVALAMRLWLESDRAPDRR